MSLAHSTFKFVLSSCFLLAINLWRSRRQEKSASGIQTLDIFKSKIFFPFSRLIMPARFCCWAATMDPFIILVSPETILNKLNILTIPCFFRHAEVSFEDERQRFVGNGAVQGSGERPDHINLGVSDAENDK